MKTILIIIISLFIFILLIFLVFDVILNKIILKQLKLQIKIIQEQTKTIEKQIINIPKENKSVQQNNLQLKTAPIDSIINIDNIQLKVIEENSCKNCYFKDTNNCYTKRIFNFNYACSSSRTDKKNIIFKKIN